jgi:hypothetical protein
MPTYHPCLGGLSGRSSAVPPTNGDLTTWKSTPGRPLILTATHSSILWTCEHRPAAPKQRAAHPTFGAGHLRVVPFDAKIPPTGCGGGDAALRVGVDVQATIAEHGDQVGSVVNGGHDLGEAFPGVAAGLIGGPATPHSHACASRAAPPVMSVVTGAEVPQLLAIAEVDAARWCPRRLRTQPRIVQTSPAPGGAELRHPPLGHPSALITCREVMKTGTVPASFPSRARFAENH